MPAKLSRYYRERIIALWNGGANVSAIVRTLRDEGRVTTRATIRRWIFRWEQDRGLNDDFRRGRPSKFTIEISEYMERRLEDDDETTSVELQRLIAREFGVMISSAAIRRHLRESLQWVVVKTRCGPMISDANKQKRLEFAKMCLENQDNFDNIIWTDESSVQLKRHCQTMRVKVGREVPFKPVAKHALKVHVWAGISKRGATNICIFEQTMDAPLYVSILKGFLVPFIQKHFEGTNYRFMQNKDPKHTSRIAKAFYKEEGTNWWLTPASSADFNPIKRVWRELTYFFAREAKLMTKKELVGGIKAFWSNAMTAAKCQRYIEHTHVVLPKIIDCEGGITGE